MSLGGQQNGVDGKLNSTWPPALNSAGHGIARSCCIPLLGLDSPHEGRLGVGVAVADPDDHGDPADSEDCLGDSAC